MTSISVILVRRSAYLLTFSQSDSMETSRSPSSLLVTETLAVLLQVFMLTYMTEVMGT